MKTVQFPFAGGMYDLLPHVQIPPGACTIGRNYEVAPEGGYRRVDGYERFDGRTAPSSASYTNLSFSTGLAAIAVGDTVTGAASAATGFIVYVDLASGSWAGGDAAGVLSYIPLTGTFVSGEGLLVGGTAHATSSNVPIAGTYDEARYKAAYRAVYAYWRAAITAVPGQGPVRGVAVFNGSVYAFRDAVGGASCVMYGSSPAGWVAKKTGLAPGGAYEIVVHNFYGASGQRALYGVSGVHKAFRWDGTTWADITTGMATDTPQHLAVHKNYLILSFANGSVQISPPADPMGTWVPLTGAGEIAMGDDVNALYSVRNDVLAIFTKNSVGLLYGADVTTWQLVKNANQMGAMAHGVNEVDGGTVFLDARGVFLLEAVQSFGDFRASALSVPIQRTMIDRGAGLVGCVLSRNKSMVRYFFANKEGVSMTFVGGKSRGWMRQTYAHQFTCMTAGEDAGGLELLVAGGDDGFVYRLDAGRSFDGTAISSTLRLPFNSQRMPTRKKRYRKLTLDIACPRTFALTMYAEYNYGSEQSDVAVVPQTGNTGGYWDEAVWDNFTWDGVAVAQASVRIDGVALNVASSFYHEDDVDVPFTLQAATLQFSIWGEQR